MGIRVLILLIKQKLLLIISMSLIFVIVVLPLLIIVFFKLFNYEYYLCLSEFLREYRGYQL